MKNREILLLVVLAYLVSGIFADLGAQQHPERVLGFTPNDVDTLLVGHDPAVRTDRANWLDSLTVATWLNVGGNTPALGLTEDEILVGAADGSIDQTSNFTYSEALSKMTLTAAGAGTIQVTAATPQITLVGSVLSSLTMNNATNSWLALSSAGELSFKPSVQGDFIVQTAASADKVTITDTTLVLSEGQLVTALGSNLLIHTSPVDHSGFSSAERNTFIGEDAGRLITTADDNTFIGYRAGYAAVDAPFMTAIGASAGAANVSGSANTYIGQSAGLLHTGANSTMIGVGTGTAATSAGNNTYIGALAGNKNVSGTNNTMIGTISGWNSISGANNTFVGSIAGAGAASASGDDNTAVGVSSLTGYSTGSNNTALGFQTGLTITTGSGNVFLGYQVASTAAAGTSNELWIDNSNTSTPLLWGDFANDTIRVNGYLDVTGGVAGIFPKTKSYTFVSPGGTGTFYGAGFYDFSTTDANLTEVGTTVNYGAANVPYAAHAFIVAGGAGAASGGSGAVTITVTGTSINDSGTRTAADTETIVADITTMATDQYFETVKKWLGTITFTLDVGATGHTSYSADFNYGLCKYEDFGNKDFTVTKIEAVGLGGANDGGFDIEFIIHDDTNWTYAATGFTGKTESYSMETDHGTESDIDNGQPFAWKRAGLSDVVGGSGLEGVLFRIVAGAANAVDFMDLHITANVNTH